MLPRIPAPGRSPAGRALAPPTAVLVVGGLLALSAGVVAPRAATAAPLKTAAACTSQVRYVTTSPVRATARTTRSVAVTYGRSRTRSTSVWHGATSWGGRATVTAGATAKITWRITAAAPARVRATVIRICGTAPADTVTATRTATGTGLRTVTTWRSATSTATAAARARSRAGAVSAAVTAATKLARVRAKAAATRAALAAVPSTSTAAAAARADALRRAQALARSAALRALPPAPPSTTPPASTPPPTTPPASSPPPTTPPGSVPPPPAASWWRPAKGTTWQWQLSGTVDTSVPAAVFDIDGENASAATVAALHAKGAKVICYFDAGGWENYRSDAAAFPASVLGNTMNGWPDERWIDIRQRAIVLPLMERRIADCKDKGFDAVEPDVVDGYTNNTGFPLTAADQLAYNTALADIAHRHGLGVALKNDPEQVAALEPSFDFAIVEECYQYGECASYTPFVRSGKAVLHVEYQGDTATFCPTTKALGFSSMKKHLSLDAWREVCS